MSSFRNLSSLSDLRVVGVSGGLNQPSRTSFLVKAVRREIEALTQASAQLIELTQVGPLLGAHLRREQLSAAGEAVLSLVENADIIVAGSPVYKGAYTGQFK